MSSTQQKDAFINFIQTQPFWDQIWEKQNLIDWAAGKLGSVNLDKLFAAWNNGNPVVVYNFCYAESGHNLERPDWVSYKTGLGPEITALQNMIYDLTGRLNDYTESGGSDQGFITTIQNEINTISKTLAQYKASGN